MDKAIGFLWENALVYLVSAVGTATVDSWRENSAIDRHLSELCAFLPKARRLIERSECWRLPIYNSIDELHSQLKDSIYEAESLVDEFEYQRTKNEVGKSFPGEFFLRNWVNNFPRTVKKVIDRLNKVYNKLEENCDRHGIPENPNQFSQTIRDNRRDTSTFLDTSNVIGRDKELNKVIRLMGVPSSGSDRRKRAKTKSASKSDSGESSSSMYKKRNVSVLPIVGMGGVGKTTFAQLVRKDPRVENHFDLIMWVCVSDNFDLVRVTKEIIESTGSKKECNLSNLDTLQVKLEKVLKSKRFLLVLDDVWSKDWQRLLAPMEGASEGSVVLVTTRSLECVDPGTSSVHLEGLEDDIYWKFFQICAFGKVAQSNNFNIPDKLEVIGKKICDKLKGSPLAAKTIGGVLGRNLDVEHWTKIKDSKLWEVSTEENNILLALQLSYQYLPSHLKKCFSFCSLYPKDYKFYQSELTMFWIMQGLIEPPNNFQQLITLGDDYFLDLVRRCLFQLYNPNLETFHEENIYVIHDLMHDVCQSITKDECICLENEHSEQVSPHIRHVSDFRGSIELNAPEELCGCNKLLSLKVYDLYNCDITGKKSWCDELTNIRSLTLTRPKIRELPKNIGNLKHLQCLDISGTRVATLPESFCSLYNLQYLNMNGCYFIKCFPKGSYNLVNLLLLCLPLGKVSLVKHIENMFKAIHFHNVNYCLSNGNNEIFKNISKFSGYLKIDGLELVSSREAAEEAQLESKPLIDSLHLVWNGERHYGGRGSGWNGCPDEEVLGGLCPHPNLRELIISSYDGTDLSPSWLKEKSWPNLTKVVFVHCDKASTVLSYLPVSLKHIEIRDCYELVSLPVESFGGFESLEWLTIESCPKLKSPNAMVLPPSVKILELGSCGDLEKSIPSCLQNLTSLERLKIENFQRLVSIPVEITNNLKYLSKLIFKNCSKLQSVGGREFLASVQTVTIEDCPGLQEASGQNINGILPSGLLEDIPLSSQDRKRRTRRA